MNTAAEEEKEYMPNEDEKWIIVLCSKGLSDKDIAFELDAGGKWLPRLMQGEERKMPPDEVFKKNKKWVSNSLAALQEKMKCRNTKQVIAECFLRKILSQEDFSENSCAPPAQNKEQGELP